MDEQDDGRGDDCEQAADEVRSQRAHHAEDGLRDYSDGYELETVNDTGTQSAAEKRVALRESEHQEGGGQGEGEPRCECSRETCSKQTDGEADLTAGRAGERLAETYYLSEDNFVEPAET